jgi:hypothetical protein
MSRIVQPSVRETAFNCPHCSAFTTQYWYNLCCNKVTRDPPIPFATPEQRETLLNNPEWSDDNRKEALKYIEKIKSGLVLIHEKEVAMSFYPVSNLHLSVCYNCKKVAVWVYDRLLFPIIKEGVPPNPDLPDDIIRDFEEAREVVNASPRGAAALLRLCIQKLCKQLGEKGKNIDDDIASLVKKGLNPLVQQSLDIVRVIGNEAAHPGVFDLKDDRDTALRLFDLVNAITDQMISHPKVVSEMYAKLPEGKRKAIETRDKK